jgi:hypothetical protein
MIKRLKTTLGVAAGLSALALGGSAIAGAASTTPTKVRPAATHGSTRAPDTDNIQSGDQTTPDSTATSKTARHAAKVSKTESSTSENSTSEAAGETSGEAAGETAPNNDGPGGHADEPGNPNADTQQQGQN